MSLLTKSGHIGRGQHAPAATASPTFPGKRDEFKELFESFHGPLCRYATSLLRDSEHAQDVVQDIFLKLWTNRDSLRIHSSMKAFLFTTVRNRCLNAIRDQKGRTAAVLPYDITQTDDGERIEAGIDGDALATRLQEWIDALPERRAEAFRLSRFAGMSHREISEVMNISERTVGTHILLALRHLRSQLDAHQQQNSEES